MQLKPLFWSPKSCMIWFLSIFLTDYVSPPASPHSSYTGFLIPKAVSPFLPLGFYTCGSFCLEHFPPAFHMAGFFLSLGVSANGTSSYRTFLSPGPSYSLSHNILFTSFKALTAPSDDLVQCLLFLFAARMLNSVRAGNGLAHARLHP